MLNHVHGIHSSIMAGLSTRPANPRETILIGKGSPCPDERDTQERALLIGTEIRSILSCIRFAYYPIRE